MSFGLPKAILHFEFCPAAPPRASAQTRAYFLDLRQDLLPIKRHRSTFPMTNPELAEAVLHPKTLTHDRDQIIGQPPHGLGDAVVAPAAGEYTRKGFRARSDPRQAPATPAARRQENDHKIRQCTARMHSIVFTLKLPRAQCVGLEAISPRSIMAFLRIAASAG